MVFLIKKILGQLKLTFSQHFKTTKQEILNLLVEYYVSLETKFESETTKNATKILLLAFPNFSLLAIAFIDLLDLKFSLFAQYLNIFYAFLL